MDSSARLSSLDDSKTKKLIWTVALVVVFLITVIFCFVYLYSRNGWQENSEGMMYLTYGEAATGRMSIDSKDYVFDEQGYYHDGWVSANGIYYYQDIDCGVYTGAQTIEGNQYNLRDDGSLITGVYCDCGTYYIYDEYGFPVSGLYVSDGHTLSGDEDGKVIYGWKNIGGNSYHFDEETGYMSVSMNVIDGNTYYFGDDGVMRRGFSDTGDGIRYFGSNGVMQTGPLKLGNDSYLLNDDGTIYKGFFTDEDGGVYYYVEEDGKQYHGWMMLGDNHLYFDEDGRRAEGWYTIEDKKYYFDEEGYVLFGWQEIGDITYYFTDDGSAAIGLYKVDDELYFFDNTGAKMSGVGWHTMYGNKYYLNDNDNVMIGFNNIGGNTYYFDSNGIMVTGLKTIGGADYYFYEDGTMARNTQIGYFQIDANGVATNVFDVITAENLDAYIEVLLDTYGRDPYSIYLYCRNNFSYKYRAKSDVTSMCCRMINNSSGACWDYAALYYKMMTAAGYNCRIVVGVGAVYSEHNWVLVEISPGVWRHVDPERQGYNIYMLTDAQLESFDGITRSVRYQWDHTAYPAAQ